MLAHEHCKNTVRSEICSSISESVEYFFLHLLATCPNGADDLKRTRFTRNKTKVVIVTNFIYQPPSIIQKMIIDDMQMLFTAALATPQFSSAEQIAVGITKINQSKTHCASPTMHCTPRYWQALLYSRYLHEYYWRKCVQSDFLLCSESN